MNIVRRIWAVLIGVKNLLVLIAMLMFFGILAAAWFASSPKVHVADGSALEIRLAGLLVDQAAEAAPLTILSGEPIIPQTEAGTLIRAIDTAASDPAIRLITLNLDRFLGGGLANLQAVGAALDRFRQADKEVRVWATAYEDDGYYLASFANEIAMSPQGAVILRGPGGSSLYFKDALDKLGVNVEVFRVGTYKSFVEPFTRQNASDEARAASQQLAVDLWQSWQQDVARARPDLDLQSALTNRQNRSEGRNRSQAEQAQDAGLIDAVMTEQQWRRKQAEELGPNDTKRKILGDYKRVSLADYRQARLSAPESGPAVAIVHVSGAIVDGESPAGAAGGDTISSLIERAIASKDVKALVVRIDSGGGSVLASEKIRLALESARQNDMPVVASFGPVAASGGYWLATAADMILASPTTVTGSIGVFGIIPTFETSLGKLGITTDGISTTELSGQPDIFGGLNDPARTMIQSSVEDVYRDFLGLVARARDLPVTDVEPIAEGRVWSGQRAVDHDLVDRFGDLNAAIAEAAERAELGASPRVVTLRPEQPMFLRLLRNFMGTQSALPPVDGLGSGILGARLKLSTQLMDARVMLQNGATIQASCLDCSSYRVAAPPPLPTASASWWQKLLFAGQ